MCTAFRKGFAQALLYFLQDEKVQPRETIPECVVLRGIVPMSLCEVLYCTLQTSELTKRYKIRQSRSRRTRRNCQGSSFVDKVHILIVVSNNLVSEGDHRQGSCNRPADIVQKENRLKAEV